VSRRTANIKLTKLSKKALTKMTNCTYRAKKMQRHDQNSIHMAIAVLRIL